MLNWRSWSSEILNGWRDRERAYILYSSCLSVSSRVIWGAYRPLHARIWARSTGRHLRDIIVGTINDQDVQKLRDLVEAAPVGNETVHWNCQDYVIENIDMLHEECIIDEEDQDYKAGREEAMTYFEPSERRLFQNMASKPSTWERSGETIKLTGPDGKPRTFETVAEMERSRGSKTSSTASARKSGPATLKTAPSQLKKTAKF